MLHAVAALTLAAVLERTGAYVATFERQLSTIVGEEHYVQTVTPRPSSRNCVPLVNNPCGGQLQLATRSELRANVTLRYDGSQSNWAEYRDVFEVDGQPVRNPPDLSKTTDLRALVDASARHNLGDIVRTVNTPLFALRVLQAANQSRFSFRHVDGAPPITVAAEPVTPGAFRASTDVWVIEYHERSRPTLVRTPEGRDVPSRGRFWIEPDTGRVLMSEIIAENRNVRATIDVSYQSEPLMGLLVPVEMREWYDATRTKTHIEAIATYGAFREIQK